MYDVARPAAVGSPVAETSDAPRLDRGRVVARLLVGGVLIATVIIGLGLLLTKVSGGGWVATTDLRVERWFAAHRTPTLNDVTLALTWLAETPVAVGLAVLLFFGLRLTTHRWRESLVIATALVGELLVFLAATALIDRPRPPVHHLDQAPPTSSFPSGHTGAAVALYGGLAVVLVFRGAWRHYWPLVILLALVPVAVAFARMYRGMHFPSDVLAGALNGTLWLFLAVTTWLGAAAVTAARSGAGTARRGPTSPP